MMPGRTVQSEAPFHHSLVRKTNMKVLTILGSRNPAGQTAQAAEACLAGLAPGTDSEDRVFLPVMKMERCRQCADTGWGICRGQGACVIEDDFSTLVEKVKAADAVVFANPVYFSDLSESLRAFLERLRRTCMNDAGKKGLEGKPAVGICVAGGGGGGAPECTASLDKVLSRCGFEVVDMLPIRRQNLQTKLDALKRTGQNLSAGPGR